MSLVDRCRSGIVPTVFVLVLALSVVAPVAVSHQVSALQGVLDRYGFRGSVVASKGERPYFDSRLAGDTKTEAPWRWASVTKQVIATLVMQEVAAGRIDLDKPVLHFLPGFKSANAGRMTVRNLLRHQTGLPNPDEVPGFYAAGFSGSRDPLTGYCAGPVTGPAGNAWAYNNCDYMVAGELLRAVTGKSWHTLVAERIAGPLELTSLEAFPGTTPTVPGFIAGKPEPAMALEAFGAAGGLYGTAFDLWQFDRALLSGRLLPAAARSELWKGDAALGFIALGQWAFDAPLKSCAQPVRLIERRGAIGGVQVRNIIAPDRDAIVVAFTNTADFEFGEIWQGRGFSHDLLDAALCGDGKP